MLLICKTITTCQLCTPVTCVCSKSVQYPKSVRLLPNRNSVNGADDKISKTINRNQNLPLPVQNPC